MIRNPNRIRLIASTIQPNSVRLTGAFLSPEDGEYDPAPKAAAGFAVTSNARRMSRAEMAKRRSLLNYKAELQAALGERPRDQVKIGKMLDHAKALIGHGGFEKWVTQELRLSARTARELHRLRQIAQL